MPRENWSAERLTNAQIRARLEESERRLDRVEPFIYTAIASAAGVGVIVGVFAHQIAKLVFGAP